MMDKVHTLHTENLSWERTDRRFHVDASTVFILPGMPVPRRLEVVSHRTGAIARYEIHDQLTRESDVVSWNYRPADGDVNAQTTRGVVIWNT